MLTTQRGGQAERENLCAVSGPVIPNILRVFARVASRSRVRAKGKASHESHSKVTPFSIPCQRGGDLMNQKPGKKTLPSCPDVVVPNDLIVQVPQHATSRAARKTIRAKNKKTSQEDLSRTNGNPSAASSVIIAHPAEEKEKKQIPCLHWPCPGSRGCSPASCQRTFLFQRHMRLSQGTHGKPVD